MNASRRWQMECSRGWIELVEFREPLGPAAKYFLPRLRAAYIVETRRLAERMAHENPQGYFLTPEGTCYHGRMVSGGRQSEAGPLALKRELRQHEAEAKRLERIAQEQQTELTRLGNGNREQARQKMASAMARARGSGKIFGGGDAPAGSGAHRISAR